MPVLRICHIPEAVLRVPALQVTDFGQDLSSFIKDMWETMYAAQGIGLAAPQVGQSKRVVVIDIAENASPKLELINPEIIEKSGSIKSEEGCLSIPEYRDSIPRAKVVKVRAQNPKGDFFEIEADGLLGRCLQHEIDHLNGILFVDHLSRLKRELYKRWLEQNPQYK